MVEIFVTIVGLNSMAKDKLSNLIFTYDKRKYYIQKSGLQFISEGNDYLFSYREDNFIESLNNGIYIPIKWAKGHTVCKDCNPFEVD